MHVLAHENRDSREQTRNKENKTEMRMTICTAPSGRATCRGCKQKIENGSWRIGYSFSGEHGGASRWFHVNNQHCYAGAVFQLPTHWREFKSCAPAFAEVVEGLITRKLSLDDVIDVELQATRLANGDLLVAGDTYPLRRVFRLKYSAEWDKTAKAWVVPADSVPSFVKRFSTFAPLSMADAEPGTTLFHTPKDIEPGQDLAEGEVATWHPSAQMVVGEDGIVRRRSKRNRNAADVKVEDSKVKQESTTTTTRAKRARTAKQQIKQEVQVKQEIN